MKIIETKFEGVKILEPSNFADVRGFFMESYNKAIFDQLMGQSIDFVQDNHSHSEKNVLRGLHYQVAPKMQGKLVRVAQGEVLDVVVDIRKSSPTFGRWFSTILSAENKRQLWIPPGFAHGFQVLSSSADYLYKTTEYYSPVHERSIAWDDNHLAINWRLGDQLLISDKDRTAPAFLLAEYL